MSTSSPLAVQKAIVFGVLFWVCIFVFVSIIGFVPNLAEIGDHGFIFNTIGQIVKSIGVLLLSFGLSRQYYKKEKKGMCHALETFMVIVFTGLILDAVITVPLFIKSYAVFFGNWKLWIEILAAGFVFSFAAKKP